jgi:transcriptional regulator with XRE-family HTH domain
MAPMITGAQIRAARAMLEWTRADLARASGISANGIANIETGASSPLAVTLERIQHALERAGVGFIDNGDGPGVQLRKTPPRA